MMYCSRCGNQISDHSAFCSYCGNPLKNSINTSHDSTVRITEYKGNLVKCPNCGGTIGSFDSVCPLCGYEFQNASGATSVQELNRQLLMIDQQSYAAVGNAAYASMRKAELIRTFAIPNTKGDVLEFMILASSNIDLTVLSAGSGDDIGMPDQEFNARRTLSDAWLAKIEQVYQKAKLSFSNDSSFDHIQKIYEQTYFNVASARELAKKAESKSRRQESQRIRAQRSQDLKIAKLGRVKKETTAGTFFKWFFIILGIIVVAAVIGGIAVGILNQKEDYQESHKDLEWPTSELAKKIPDSRFPYGEVKSISDDELSIDVFNVSLTQFDSYVSECKEVGFIYNAKSISGNYEAYTQDGYYLNLDYYSSSKTMRIELSAPIKASDIDWDSLSLRNQFPLPSSSNGSVERNDKNYMHVYVTDISIENFKEYVEACKYFGYTVGIDEQDKRLRAYNTEGYHIDLDYDDSVRQTLSITIEAPEELKEIKWPTTGLATKIPEPPTNLGKISDSQSWFNATVQMTKDQFDEYVEACKMAGFTEDVFSPSTGDSFRAKNSSGDSLSMYYYANNQVHISLSHFH